VDSNGLYMVGYIFKTAVPSVDDGANYEVLVDRHQMSEFIRAAAIYRALCRTNVGAKFSLAPIDVIVV
jgi:hypothetical protein